MPKFISCVLVLTTNKQGKPCMGPCTLGMLYITNCHDINTGCAIAINDIEWDENGHTEQSADSK